MFVYGQVKSETLGHMVSASCPSVLLPTIHDTLVALTGSIISEPTWDLPCNALRYHALLCVGSHVAKEGDLKRSKSHVACFETLMGTDTAWMRDAQTQGAVQSCTMPDMAACAFGQSQSPSPCPLA